MATSSPQAVTCGPEGREIEPSGPKNSLIGNRTVMGSTREMLKKTYFGPRILGELQCHVHRQSGRGHEGRDR